VAGDIPSSMSLPPSLPGYPSADLDQKNRFDEDGDDGVGHHDGEGEADQGPTLRGAEGQVRNILKT